MKWYDAHCHLSVIDIHTSVEELINSAEKKEIHGWLSCALNKEELYWHQLHRHDKIKFCAGIHPLYDEGTPLTIDLLEKLAKEKQIFAIGEIGLDKRNRDIKTQLKIFQDQMSLAKSIDLPVVFHIVGYYEEFYNVLQDIPVRGIWHGFSASKEIVAKFSKFDITFSLGNTLIKSLKHNIINEVVKYGNYLIETDAPFNIGKIDKTTIEAINPLTELIDYGYVVSRLSGVHIKSLVLDMEKNIKQYFI